MRGSERRVSRLAPALEPSRDDVARDRVLAGAFWRGPLPEDHLASVFALPIRRRP